MYRYTLICLIALCGCSKGVHPIIDDIQIDVFEGSDLVAMTEAQLRDRFVEFLEEEGFKVSQKSSKNGTHRWSALVAVGVFDLDVQETIELEVVLQLRQRDSMESWTMDVRSTQDSGTVQKTLRKTLHAKLRQAVREGCALINFASRTNQEVVDRLESADATISRAAVRVLARRGDARVLPLLLRGLHTEDLKSLRETIGLLVELGHPDAVPALIDASRMKDDVMQREIVFVLGEIGGNEAAAYLDVVAAGHDNPLVRASAEQALAEMKVRNGVSQ